MPNEANYVSIIGPVKRDARAERMRAGVVIMGFTLTVNGNNGEPPAYIDCFASNEVVDQLEGYVTEGEVLEVHGYLSFRTMTDHKGVHRSRLMVIVDEVYELDE